MHTITLTRDNVVNIGSGNNRMVYDIPGSRNLEGAEIAFTYQNESFKKGLTPLMESLKSTICYECDVSEDENHVNSIESLFKKIYYVNYLFRKFTS